jgi:hypothetical protein
MGYPVASSRGRAAARPPGASSLLTGLAAYYPFETLTLDATGHGNNLTNTNGVTQAAGKVGQAASFVAANSQQLQIASNLPLQINGDWTWAGWFKPATLSGVYQNLFYAPNVRVFLSGTTSQLAADDLSHGGVSPGPTLSPGTWYFGWVQWDSATMMFRASVNNGTQASNAPGSPLSSGASFVHMGDNGSGNYYGGLLDEVGVWNRKLTPAEMAALYNGGAGVTYPFEQAAGGGWLTLADGSDFLLADGSFLGSSA